MSSAARLVLVIVVATISFATTMVVEGISARHPDVLGLCVLPLGDSLTQGVGSHSSYREPLQRMVLDYVASGINGSITTTAMTGDSFFFLGW